LLAAILQGFTITHEEAITTMKGRTYLAYILV
jgi:hypothetical protein